MCHDPQNNGATDFPRAKIDRKAYWEDSIFLISNIMFVF